MVLSRPAPESRQRPLQLQSKCVVSATGLPLSASLTRCHPAHARRSSRQAGAHRRVENSHLRGVADRLGSALDCAQSGEGKPPGTCFRSRRVQCRVTPERRFPLPRETRKAREDAMSHEPGSLPVLPSEFSIRFSPIPKSLLPLARQPTPFVTRIPPNLLTLRHLNQFRDPSAGVLGAFPNAGTTCYSFDTDTRNPDSSLLGIPDLRRKDAQRLS